MVSVSGSSWNRCWSLGSRKPLCLMLGDGLAGAGDASSCRGWLQAGKAACHWGAPMDAGRLRRELSLQAWCDRLPKGFCRELSHSLFAMVAAGQCSGKLRPSAREMSH